MGISGTRAMVLLRELRDTGIEVEARASEYLLGGTMLRFRALDAVSFDLDAHGDDWMLVMLRHDAPDSARTPYPAELTLDASPREVMLRVLEEILCAGFLVREAEALERRGLDHRDLATTADLIQMLFDEHDIDAEVIYWAPPQRAFSIEFAGFPWHQLVAGAARWEFHSGTDDLDVGTRVTRPSPLRLTETDDATVAAWMLHFLLTSVVLEEVGDLSPVAMTEEQAAVVRNAVACLHATAERRDGGGLAARQVLHALGAWD